MPRTRLSGSSIALQLSRTASVCALEKVPRQDQLSQPHERDEENDAAGREPGQQEDAVAAPRQVRHREDGDAVVWFAGGLRASGWEWQFHARTGIRGQQLGAVLHQAFDPDLLPEQRGHRPYPRHSHSRFKRRHPQRHVGPRGPRVDGIRSSRVGVAQRRGKQHRSEFVGDPAHRKQAFAGSHAPAGCGHEEAERARRADAEAVCRGRRDAAVSVRGDVRGVCEGDQRADARDDQRPQQAPRKRHERPQVRLHPAVRAR
mmetsp:Transcript_51048/g.120930  ORF Transcript_51048/g.120930 Transcript_51048/m.120930 type:complete len:259 (-) Transcript_51048:767-1543(-)